MIRLSVNLLHATLDFLITVKEFTKFNAEELPLLNRFYQIPYENLYELSLQCGWIYNESEIIYVSEEGNSILNNHDKSPESLRRMIFDYVRHYKPIWGYKVPYGRKEAIFMMSKDERSCFFESGLLSENPDYRVVSWWDELAAGFRMHSDEYKNTVGRDGELLTITYEESRIGKKPQWMSIDSNLAGYDILSRVSDTEDYPLLIEVKSSEQKISNAFFYISSNEWNTAIASKNYLFYLWSIGSQKKLAILSPQMIAKYIPINNDVGEWVSVKIPFKVFESEFKLINGDNK
ncbi:protein NO VEIN domain-containing protein [Roseburia sp. MSJ-14]|uniref:protein NO VEIN domain-containing protein n=1 Tax=Roseburia sp. MSJ-14 TaxID=2841514 RepID=UPI001C11D33A|nr:DUF3883 domain-containing protein [Roseburia sp. MSJ-14]